MSKRKKSLALAILVTGFSGLVAQMLLLRELLIVFSGNELSIGIIIANWLILEAGGCFFLGKRAEKAKNRVEIFVGITTLFSLSLGPAVYLIRILKNILGISIGESVGFLPMLYSSFLILLPVSVFHGALFPFLCKIYSQFFIPPYSSVGKVYVYEMVGTIMGGLIWTYFLIPYFQAFEVAVGLAILNFLVSLGVLIFYRRFGLLAKANLAINMLLLIFFTYLLFGGGGDKLHYLSLKKQWKHQTILHYQSSIYGNICVIEREGQYIYFLDGIPQIIIPFPDIGAVEEFVHLPLLAHPYPKRLLILSGGAGGIISEILRHPQVLEIEYVELDPLLLKLIKRFSTPLTEEELNNKKVKIKYIDGRLFIKITPNRYDLILVGLEAPSDLQTNRFFTQEFFSLVKKKLNKKGILVISLPGSLTYLSQELKNLNACIFHTLKSVFSYVRVFPGEGRNLFFSSDSKEISLIDRTRIISQLKERKIRVNVPVARHIEKKLHPGWQEWFLRFIAGSTNKINQDFRPWGVFYSISYWNALFAPYLCRVFRGIEKINLGMFLGLFAFLVILFLPKPKNKSLSIPLSIVTTGFAAMMFDLILIFTFQSIYGYVFSWIGLLVASFMAGAGWGAMIITSLLTRIKNNFRFFIYTELAIILFSLILTFIFLGMQSYLESQGVFPYLKILFLLLSFISGVLIGMQFPLANQIYLRNNPGLSQTVGLLYSADLLGGWLGGVIGAVVLLPVLGLFYTCAVIFLLKLSSFIVLATSIR